MLVFGRKRNQSIRIGDDIKITINDVRGEKVRIGVEAPKSVTVHREEIYQLIEANKKG